MTTIRGGESLTPAEIREAIANGATLVRYPYVLSAVLVTLRYESTVHLARTDDGRYWRAIPYLFVSLLFGWWAVPWGPILTARAVWACLSGGTDETAELLPQLDR